MHEAVVKQATEIRSVSTLLFIMSLWENERERERGGGEREREREREGGERERERGYYMVAQRYASDFTEVSHNPRLNQRRHATMHIRPRISMTHESMTLECNATVIR